MVSSADDNLLLIWDQITWQVIGSINDHTDEITDLIILSNSSLATCSYDQTINIFSYNSC